PRRSGLVGPPEERDRLGGEVEIGYAPGDRDLARVYPRAHLGRVQLNDWWCGVHLHPGLGRIAGGGWLIAETGSRPCHQADPTGPPPPQIALVGGAAVGVVTAGDPRPPAVLGDPELDAGRTVRPGVVDRVLELEPWTLDQQRISRAATAAGRRGAGLCRAGCDQRAGRCLGPPGYPLGSRAGGRREEVRCRPFRS